MLRLHEKDFLPYFFYCSDNYTTRVGAGLVVGTGTGTGVQHAADKTSHKKLQSPYNPIQAFLQQHSPCSKGDLGVQEEVMKTFMKSCAGYCVITYILGKLRTYHPTIEF